MKILTGYGCAFVLRVFSARIFCIIQYFYILFPVIYIRKVSRGSPFVRVRKRGKKRESSIQDIRIFDRGNVKRDVRGGLKTLFRDESA